MRKRKLHEFVYEFENVVDEFAILALSLGAVFVLFWTFFNAPSNVNMQSLGRIIEPWVTMVALMIIGRELWLLNRNLTSYLENKGE